MLVGNLDSAWLILLGCSYTLTSAAVVIAALFRQKLVALAALYSAISSVIISLQYSYSTASQLPANYLFNSSLLDLSLILIFALVIACLLRPFYQGRRYNHWLLLLAIPVLLPALLTKNYCISGFYLSLLTLISICTGFALYAFGQFQPSVSAILLSISKLIIGSAVAWLTIQSNARIILEKGSLLGVSILYLVDMAILTSICWRAYNRAAIEKAENRIALARQQTKIASLAPLIKASRHDLRAPLADIIGLAELIDDGPLDLEQKKITTRYKT